MVSPGRTSAEEGKSIEAHEGPMVRPGSAKVPGPCSEHQGLLLVAADTGQWAWVLLWGAREAIEQLFYSGESGG